MRPSECGMALVTVLFVLTLLMLMALVLTDKIWQTTRQVIQSGQQERTLWAANAGIERARHELAIRYQATNGWQAYLQEGDGRYPQTPAWDFTVDEIPVAIYLRDNPDGDADPTRDNDLKLFALARAKTRRGPEILIESLCGFADGATAAYVQHGESFVNDETRLPTVLAEGEERYGIGE